MNIEAASTYHRYIIVTVLIAIVTAFTMGGNPALLLIVEFAMWGFNVFCCYKLAEAIGRSAVVWAILGLIGFLLLWIPQLLLLNESNKAFKAQGMKIGFFGGATKVAELAGEVRNQ